VETPIKFSLDLMAARLPDLLAASRRESIPLHAEITEGDMHSIPVEPGAWRPFNVQDRWGSPGESSVIRFRFTVPEAWAEERVYLRFRPSEYGGAEGLLYVDGEPFQGFDTFHHDAMLTGSIRAGREYQALFEAHIWILSKRAHILQELELVRVDAEAEGLYHDLRVLLEAVGTMPPESVDRGCQVRILERAYRALDLRHPQSDDYLTSVGQARTIVQEAYADEVRAGSVRTIAVGHAHIDLAWMWSVAQTRRKGARTFSTVLRLMEQYPDYHFVASQPALYEFIREDEPHIYQEILERIREGRWEATGASWVEMDCNITGAESLVRQFLLGKRYFRETLGVDPKVLWLPDVFGYSGAMPQVLKGCDVQYFMTTKISWNEYNRLPYDTFRWRGIDGTEVLTHMVTVPDNPATVATAKRLTYTYNAKLSPADIAGNWAQYRQKDINNELLYLYGFGDGGGGPTAAMEEAGERLKDLPGFPMVEQSAAEAFFTRLDQRVWDDPDLPTWVGELYLEYHRGTYTSQAWIKRANRKSELLLHDAELWASAAEVWLGKPVGQDERSALEEAWKCLLFNQFHDILPGSSIREVYEDARNDFAGITERGERVRDAALAALTSAVRVDAPSAVIFNPAPFQRNEPYEMALPAGVAVPDEAQRVGDGPDGGTRVVMRAGGVPGMGYAVHPLATGRPPVDSSLTVSKTVLENRFLRMELDEDGLISSLVDKRTGGEGREIIAPGERGNEFITFEDRPLTFDAWDIQIDYADKPYPVCGYRSWEVVEDGPLRAAIEIVRQVGESTISQRMVMYHNVPRIDFKTHIDWHERQTLLKVAFPVSVNSTRATFDIQWGNVERPTHWNTSWDWARFETCAHKWIDLSEGDYGVSLLNDCKYGHDVKGHTMRLTLLRSPIDPDPTADQGSHDFTYSLFPHAGDWRTNTIAQAYALNMPLAAFFVDGPQEGGLPAHSSLVQSTSPSDRGGTVIETVKPAENGDGTIVRFYEAHNARGGVVLRFGRTLASAEETNMLEERIAELPVDGDSIAMDIRPYEIKTVRVRFTGR
jgi:alpha-mannosidase